MNENLPVEEKPGDQLRQLVIDTLNPNANVDQICTQIVDTFFAEKGIDTFYLFAERERLIKKLSVLLKHHPGVNIFEKTIIDLGSGHDGKSEISGLHDPRNEPWFCRLLHRLGIPVIGIDIGPMHEEPFRNFQADLTANGSLNFLPDELADVVIADNFYTTEEHLYRKPDRPEFSYRTIRQTLFPQIRRILKPRGFYLENDEISFDHYHLHYACELDHEQYSIREVGHHLKEITNASDQIRFHTAIKIASLILPYLTREYNYHPDHDSFNLIEFHCGAILEKIAQIIPPADFHSLPIIEFTGSPVAGAPDKRIFEPWISRFLEIIGARPMVIPLQATEESRHCLSPELVMPAEKSVEVIISPIMDKIDDKEKELYCRMSSTFIKENGMNIKREFHSISSKE